MSSFSLNGTPLQRARLTVPRRGVWEGTCATAGQLDLALGTSISLVLGDTTFSGYVVSGGTFAGATESTYTIAGGSAGWTRVVPARGFSAPGGALLRDVVAQLAADAGEIFDLTGISATAVLGDHWQRPAGVASAALSALFPIAAGGWRVDPDGAARVGARPPTPLPVDLQYAVEDAPRDRRWARIGVADDRVSAFLPGAVVTAPNMSSPLVVGDLTIRAEVERVVVEVVGETGLVELLAALVAALMPPVPLLGEYRYSVVDDNGAPSLRAVDPSTGIPPVLACAKVYGVPGVAATLPPGAIVLVSFLDGSPSNPRVTGYVSGTPLEVDMAAATVKLGPTSAALPLALAAPISTWAASVNTALAAAGHAVPALGAIATTAVSGS